MILESFPSVHTRDVQTLCSHPAQKGAPINRPARPQVPHVTEPHRWLLEDFVWGRPYEHHRPGAVHWTRRTIRCSGTVTRNSSWVQFIEKFVVVGKCRAVTHQCERIIHKQAGKPAVHVRTSTSGYGINQSKPNQSTHGNVLCLAWCVYRLRGAGDHASTPMTKPNCETTSQLRACSP